MHKSHLALTITRWLGGDNFLALPCEFAYDAGDPLAVTVTFTVGGEWSVRWVIAREQLAAGLTTRSGKGDVALWPVYDEDGEVSTLGMRLGSGNVALFEIPAEPVVQWLAQTYTLVARGAEFDGANWDELLQPAERDPVSESPPLGPPSSAPHRPARQDGQDRAGPAPSEQAENPRGT